MAFDPAITISQVACERVPRALEGWGQAYLVTETTHSSAYGLLIHHQTVHKKSQKSVYQTPDECSVVCARSRKRHKKQSKRKRVGAPLRT